MKLACSSKFFSAIPVRDFLSKSGYQPVGLDLQIAWGLIWESNGEVEEARKNSHLTNSTDIDHQIRFVLKDRVERSIKRLAYDLKKQVGHLGTSYEVSISPDDFISIEFFKFFPEVKVQFRIDNQESSELLTSREWAVLSELVQVIPSEELILRKAQERIYVGDYACAYKILLQLSQTSQREEISYMLGLCTNFFGRTAESERHFSRLLHSPNPVNIVKSSYVISMLYLRMHPKELQSREKAESLLENAYQVLGQHPEVADHTFHKVFNRNGFALCLYRRGQITEALALLEHGIAELGQDHTGANALHQSVLIYNAVQCLRTLQRYEECEAQCLRLLAVDPLFPEYWLELSRVLLEQGKVQLAIEALEKAMSLDELIPETHALLGFAYLELNQMSQAVKCYRKACELDPQETQWASDLEYCLEELEIAL